MAVMTFAPTPPAFAQDITDGLVGWWRLDETSGTTAFDSSGYENDGSLGGGMNAGSVSVPGVLGGGMNYDDTSDHYIEVSPNASIGNIFSGGGTLSAWVNPRTAGEYNAGGIFYKTTNAGTLPQGYVLRFEGSARRLMFRKAWATGRHEWRTSSGIPANEWTHVAVTFDSDVDTNTPTFYVNGEPVSFSLFYDIGGGGASPNDAGVELYVGDWGLDGYLDDARVYNRILAPNEIMELYELREETICAGEQDGGKMLFNPDYAVMQYCDGEDWIDMGKEASVLHGQKTEGENYAVNGVNFGGTYSLFSDSLNGMNDSDRFTASFWVKPSAETGVTDFQVIFNNYTGAENHFMMALDNGNSTSDDLWAIYIYGRNDTNINVLEYQSADILPANQWSHVLVSLDAGNSTFHSYINDSADSWYVDITPSEGNIDFDAGENALGGYAAGGTNLNAGLADLYLNTGTYIDLSEEANRRKFINAEGRAVDLGADGSGPTGSSPEIFLSGDAGDWETNNGTAGNFTGTGTLSNDSTTPPATIEKKLLGWWKLNETAGTVAYDSSGNGHDGAMSGGLSASDHSVEGSIGRALEFDGTDDIITVADHNDLDFTDSITIAAWVYLNDNTLNMEVVNKKADSHLHGYRMNLFNGELAFEFSDGITAQIYASAPSDWLESNRWYHVSATYDREYIRLYVDGNLVEQQAQTEQIAVNAQDLKIGGYVNESAYWFDGAMDDVRIYNYALSEEEIEELYHVGSTFYEPNAVEFDGSSDYLTLGGGMTGVSDSKRMTFSFWVRTEDTTYTELFSSDPVHRLAIEIDGDGYVALRASDSTGTPILNAPYLTSDPINDGQWHHILYSTDMAGTDHLLVDGVLQGGADGSGTFIDGIIDFTWSNAGFGANTGGNSRLNGEIADFWFDSGTYFDLSIESNQRKFITAGGAARFLGDNGELVTGEAPDVFLSGDTATWHTNKGTAGGFTENGALTDADTAPPGETQPRICADSGLPSGTLIYNSDEEVISYCDGYRDIPLGPPGDGGMGCSNPSGEAGSLIYNNSFAVLQYCDGRVWRGVGADPLSDLLSADLAGHWRFDETEGGVGYDSSGNDLHLGMVGGMDAGDAATAGVRGGAFTFNGSTNYLADMSNDPLLRVSHNTSFTASAWVKTTSNGTFSNIMRYDDLDGADGDNNSPRTFLIYGIHEDGRIIFRFGPSSNDSSLEAPAGSVSNNRWHLITAVRDVARDRQEIYVDGELVADQADSTTGTWETTGQYLMIGRYENAPPGEYFSGAMDDVRFYRRALSDYEVAALYNTTGGASPQGCPNIGDACSDGTVYAGISNGAPIYAMPCDIGQTYSGGACTGTRGTLEYGSFGTARNINDLDNGQANTLALMAFGAAAHPAANACASSNFAAKNDWYLPASNELSDLQGASSEGAFVGTFANGGSDLPYWSSTEDPAPGDAADFAYLRYMNNNTLDWNWKSDTMHVRCVRKTN